MIRIQTQDSLFRQILHIVFLAALLAFAHNWFSVKRLPLIREEVLKVAASDSELFHTPVGDSGFGRHRSPDVKVIAPLHAQALTKEDSTQAATPGQGSKQVYRIIALSQLTRLLAEGHSFLIDARDTAAFRKGHIKGSRNMFGLATDQYFPELAPMQKDTLAVIYCNNPDCHLGRMLAEFMGALGFKNLYLYDDGWDGWVKAGMPVDSTPVASPGRP